MKTCPILFNEDLLYSLINTAETKFEYVGNYQATHYRVWLGSNYIMVEIICRNEYGSAYQVSGNRVFIPISKTEKKRLPNRLTWDWIDIPC